MADPEIVDLQDYIEKLKAGLDAFVLTRFKEGEGFESESWKATHVQGYRKKWNAKKLREILTPLQWKKATVVQVDPQAIDEMVRAKELNRKDIEDAFEETPNKPYVKWTAKKDTAGADARAETQADKLAGLLGD